MSQIPIQTVVDYSAFIAERTQNFTGRDWVFRQLDDWLAAGKPPVFLLTGAPGTGKTALAARLVEMSLGQAPADGYDHLGADTLSFYHFCQSLRNSTLDPHAFIEALSRQLANRYPVFATALLQAGDQSIVINATQSVTNAADGAKIQNVVINNLNTGAVSPRSAFDRVVRRPLERLCAAGCAGQIVILIDSLDEALGYDPDQNLVSLLAQVIGDGSDLPPQIRFILTSRPDPQTLNLLAAAPQRRLDLIDDAPANVNDVYVYAYSRLADQPEPARRDLAGRIAAAAAGNFLYARYVLDEIITAGARVPDIDHLALPADLAGIYRQFLQQELGQNLDRWSQLYRPILGPVAVARGAGLTRTQLAGISKMTQSQADDVLRACAQFLAGSQPDGPFHIYHESFRDFLLQDATYQVYPAEANAAIADYFVTRFAGNWIACQDAYALKYTPLHEAEAARPATGPEQHVRLAALVDLVLDPGFQSAHLAVVSDLPGLERHLVLALNAAVAGLDPNGPALVTRAALGLAGFRRSYLQPGPLIDLARAGKLQEAVDRLALFGAPLEWQQATSLTLAWLAKPANPAAVQALIDSLAGELQAVPELSILLARVRAAPADPPAGTLPALPAAPSPVDARDLIARMGGMDSDGMLSNPDITPAAEAAEATLAAGAGFSPEPTRAYPAATPPVFLADQDSPLLVAYAVANPEEGTLYVKQAIGIYAANAYPQYRRRSLWGILAAIVRHPDAAWVLGLLPLLEGAVLNGNNVEFQEGLPLVIQGLQVAAGQADAGALAMQRARMIVAAGRLRSRKRQGDVWGRFKRRLTAYAEMYARGLGQAAPAVDLLQRAAAVPFGYAGYQAPACFTFAEGIAVCGADAQVSIADVLKAAQVAAHNVQDPLWCALATARFNAMQRRWWASTPDAAALTAAVADFARDSSAPVYAALHVVGEAYAYRHRARNKVPLPDWLRNANSLTTLAQLYRRPVAELRRLNAVQNWAPDTALAAGTLVNIPDPGFAPQLAGRLAAWILVVIGLTDVQRVSLLQQLVPAAMTSLTALDTVLYRLLLAAHPTAGDVLAQLARLAAAAPARPPVDQP